MNGRLATTKGWLAIVRRLLVIMSACACLALAQTPAAPDEEVRAAERQFNDARAHADVDALGRLLADDWTITHADGTTDTKAKYLADLKSGARAFTSIVEDKVAVRLYGDTAVVSGFSDSTVQYNGQPSGGALYFTRVYMKRGGVWKMIVSHATRRPR